MKNLNKLLILILLVNGISASGQVIKEDAHTYIKILKQGALFVRLKTSDLAINGLKKKGKEKEGEEVKAKQEVENKAIAAAFKSEFTFCPVYFFYSGNSILIKEGNCQGVLFDSDLKSVSAANCSDFLIGEFDESETTHIDAFIMKDKNFNQLKAPFPYLVKSNGILTPSRKKEDVVRILNQKLNEFWAKNQ